MQIAILEIIYKNIRNFKDIVIDLKKEQSSAYKMSLIMMPNGTGKTTTLTLLRFLLNQEGEKLSKEEILSFRPNDNIGEGIFGIKLKIDEKIYGLYLEFDYINGSSRYKTSLTANVNGGKRKGWLIEQIKSEFTKDFVNRFIFDGELANEMLSLKKREAENAIKYLYRVDKLQLIVETIKDLKSDKINSKERKTIASSDKGLSRVKNEYEKYDSIYSSLIKEKQSLESKISVLRVDLKDLNDKYSTAISEQNELNTKKIKIETGIEQEKFKKNTEIKNILNQMKAPEILSPLFKGRMENLYNNLKTLKLPKNISKQFFRQLANEDRCICGRHITSIEREHIINVSNQYLGEENIGFLNAMKESISSLSNDFNLEDKVDEIIASSNRVKRLQTDLDRVVKEINDNGGVEVRDLSENIDNIKLEISNMESKYEQLISTNINSDELSYKNNIKICSNKLKESKEKYDDTFGTLTYTEQCDEFKDIIEKIMDKTLNKLKERIIKDTNIRIEKVIKRDKILIDKIDGGISIKNKLGVSVGQALSVVYCFLGTMFEKSLLKLPFVIDSPCNSLDLEVRAKIAEIIPTLFHQIIIFIISSEKAGFVENLNIDKNELQFITVYKSDRDSEEVMIENGFEFFNSFQEE